MDALIAQLHQLINTLTSGQSALTTVASGGLIVWLITNLKTIWGHLVDAVKACISFTITNQYEINRNKDLSNFQQAFNEIISTSTPLWDRSQNFDFEQYRNADDNKDLSMMYGTSLRWMLGRFAVVTRSIESGSTVVSMKTTIRIFFSRKAAFTIKLMRQVIEEVRRKQANERTEDFIRVALDNSSPDALKYKRSLDSIFTNGDVHKELYEDICRFIANEKTYRKLNYPYSYSALLYGVPGAGKSSTILAIASALNRSIEYVNLSKTSLGELQERFRTNTKHKIFVFEDIDALSTGISQNREEGGVQPEQQPVHIPSGSLSSAADKILSALGVSLSDLLNITDGLLASDGAICLFTTNHVEKLDPALLRAGRMNKRIELTYLDGKTAARMANAYVDCGDAEFRDGIKPAELQDCILGVLLGTKTKNDLITAFGKEKR